MQNETSPQSALRGPGLLPFLLLYAACSPNGSSDGFQPARESTTTANSAGGERMQTPPGANPGSIPPGGAQGLELEWETPAGWTEMPVNNFRQANFRLPGNDKAECYLSLLGGEAGGLESNITRWRSQISLPPLAPAELAQLPHTQLL